MALLDVSEVINDVDFSTLITVKRASVTIGSDGIGREVSEFLTCRGVIEPIASSELERLPEGELLKGGCYVYSDFQFLTGRDTQSADCLNVLETWYIVTSVEAWAMYGKGYSKATCKLLSVRNEYNPAPL